MEFCGHSERLTNRQIVRLAAAISTDNLESIAEGYMGIEPETVKNLQDENRGKAQAFNRAILRYWANKHPENQVQRLAALLRQAAEDCGYVDPVKVEQILNEAEEEKHGAEKCTVSEKELLNLAEDLRPHTVRSMKMEPASWIRDYLVDMEELYTELTLEKIDQKLFMEERRKLESYKELFASLKPGMFEYLDIRYYYPNLIPKTKILVKGGPGMGKTSLVKKITWDWAKRLFVNVSIVFFVFLKLVKPGDLIEDAIIQQMHVLQGKHVTKKKLTGIFQSFGSKCLLILDGLDECALGLNNEVQKIITGSKLINCNIMLTSRPHSTREFERYFDTIISVEGFTRSEARKFALRIVSNEHKVENVLNFNPAGERSDRPVHNVPILLSFLCLLVREDNIDLTDKTISMGEIYFRMVQCLYKKFTLRKRIDFQMNALLQVLKSLGKLALATLLSGNQLLKRSQIIEQVGEEVFEYGLLIGEDGFSLTRDMAVDILVTFPHRSLQEFLGAFFFVASPEEVQKVCRGKIYHKVLSDSLFLQFCFWFLKKSDDLFFTFQQKQSAIELLATTVANQVDNVKVDLNDILRMLRMFQFDPILGNDMVLDMLVEILTDCRKMQHLEMDSGRLSKRILSSLGPVFKSLKSIQISTYNKEAKINRLMTDEVSINDIHVFMSIKNAHSDFEIVNTICENCVDSNKKLFLHIDYDGPKHLKLTKMLHKTVKGLDLEGHNQTVSHNGSQEFVNLTRLALSRLVIKDVQLNRFPQLTHVSLSECYTENKNCLLSLLLRSECLNLKHLYLSDLSDMSKAVEFLGNVNEDLHASNVPNLESLALSLESFDAAVFDKMMKRKWRQLRRFKLQDIDENIYNVFVTALNDKKFVNLVELCLYFKTLKAVNIDVLDLDRLPYLRYLTLHKIITSADQIKKISRIVAEHKLKELDISHYPVLRGELLRLLTPEFQSLRSLSLSHCQLNSSDLKSLNEANMSGRLPRLRHLDLSHNDLRESLSILLAHPFPLLNRLILIRCSLNVDNMQCLARARFQGMLPKIKLLNVAENFEYRYNPLELLTVDPETQDKIAWKTIIDLYKNRYHRTDVYVSDDADGGIGDDTDEESIGDDTDDEYDCRRGILFSRISSKIDKYGEYLRWPMYVVIALIVTYYFISYVVFDYLGA